MSVYNSEKYIVDSIESILSQTFTDFEFIIIDDGSTDNTARILSNFLDPRITVIHNEKNIGLVASLNIGIAIAHGEYIARMDADDISLPDRFAQQIEYLKQHPEVGVVGGWYQWMNVDGKPMRVVRFPVHDNVLRWQLIVDVPPLCHPSVMMRKKAIKSVGGYANYLFAQDYDLWRRLSMGWKINNLPMVLLKRREHPARIGIYHSSEQSLNAAKTRQKLINDLLGEEISLDFVRDSFPPRSNGVDDTNLVQLIERLYKKFDEVHDLTKGEHTEIDKEVGTYIGRMTFKDPKKKIYYLFKACKMNPEQIGDLVKDKTSKNKVSPCFYNFLKTVWYIARRITYSSSQEKLKKKSE